MQNKVYFLEWDPAGRTSRGGGWRKSSPSSLYFFDKKDVLI